MNDRERRMKDALARRRVALDKLSTLITPDFRKVLDMPACKEGAQDDGSLEGAADGCARFHRALRNLDLDPTKWVEGGWASFFLLAPTDEALARFPGVEDPVAMKELCAAHVVCLPAGSNPFAGEGPVALRSLQGTLHHGVVEGGRLRFDAIDVSLEAVRSFSHGVLVPLPGVLRAVRGAHVAPEQAVGKASPPSSAPPPDPSGRVEFRINPARGSATGGTAVWLYCSAVSPFIAEPRVFFGGRECDGVKLIGPGFIECRSPALDMGDASEWDVTVCIQTAGGARPACDLSFSYFRGQSAEEESEEEESAGDGVQEVRAKKAKCSDLMADVTTDLNAAASLGEKNPPLRSILDKRDPEGRNVLHLLAEIGAGSLISLAAVLSKPQCPILAPDKDGRTPLHAALRAGNGAAVRLLAMAEAKYASAASAASAASGASTEAAAGARNA